MKRFRAASVTSDGPCDQVRAVVVTFDRRFREQKLIYTALLKALVGLSETLFLLLRWRQHFVHIILTRLPKYTVSHPGRT